uniref:Uncharacterized protein n=1 Tax=Anguilla anguilla TaxID=7936 RepID=A0A0E9SP96_ANGAN
MSVHDHQSCIFIFYMLCNIQGMIMISKWNIYKLLVALPWSRQIIAYRLQHITSGLS